MGFFDGRPSVTFTFSIIYIRTYFLAKTRMVCTMILAGEGCIYWIDHERFIQLTKLRGSRSTLHLHFIWIMYVVVFDCHQKTSQSQKTQMVIVRVSLLYSLGWPSRYFPSIELITDPSLCFLQIDIFGDKISEICFEDLEIQTQWHYSATNIWAARVMIPWCEFWGQLK